MKTPKSVPHLNEAKKVCKQLVREYFKNDYGQPFELTDSQSEMFLIIFMRLFPRNLFLTYTQYGKTDVVSMALILRSQIFKDNWTIVAGKKDKGMLIMRKVLQHVFDHEQFFRKLELDKDMPLERLKRERSKENITWQGGGSIRVLSAQTGNRKVIEEALIGEGGQNIIEEEAPHIPDDVHAMVMRMLIGHQDNFLLKIGNAFKRNHYYRSSLSDKYARLVVDYKQGIKEGRITQEQIDEVKDLPFFSELYECKFPDSDVISIDGYRVLFPDDLLEKAFISEAEANELKLFEGRPRLGADFAGGGNDRSAYVLRWPKIMMLKEVNQIADTMQQVPIIERLIDEHGIEEKDVGIDYGGLGQGVGDRLLEKERFINCVHFGASAPDKEKYKNIRAYMYYEFFVWLKNGGRIVRNDAFFELNVINYKESSEAKFQIQPKEELKKLAKLKGLAISSPDVADAGALTFADNTTLVDEDDFEFI